MQNFLQDPPGVVGWFAMDAPKVTNLLAGRKWVSKWGPAKVVDSVLRGVAQVVFVNNPVSGLLVLVGLYLADVTVGCATIFTSLVAVFVAKAVLALPNSQMGAGLPVFSAVLVGSVTTALYPGTFHAPLTPATWAYMGLAAALSVCIYAGLGHILGAHDLPAYTLPFNIATSLIFLGMQGAGYEGSDTTTAPPDPSPLASTALPLDAGFNGSYVGLFDVFGAVSREEGGEEELLEWDKVWLGALLSAGQVWAVKSVCCSGLVLLAMLLCSPLLTAVCCVGGTLGSLTALVVSSPPHDLIYSGVWGYNGFLAAGAMVFFVVPGPRVVLLAVFNAVLATFTQAAITPVFAQNNVPVFTFPFCLASLLLLAAAASSSAFARVTSPTFPEMHLYKYRQKAASMVEKKEEKEDTASGGCVA